MDETRKIRCFLSSINQKITIMKRKSYPLKKVMKLKPKNETQKTISRYRRRGWKVSPSHIDEQGKGMLIFSKWSGGKEKWFNLTSIPSEDLKFAEKMNLMFGLGARRVA